MSFNYDVWGMAISFAQNYPKGYKKVSMIYGGGSIHLSEKKPDDFNLVIFEDEDPPGSGLRVYTALRTALGGLYFVETGKKAEGVLIIQMYPGVQLWPTWLQLPESVGQEFRYPNPPNAEIRHLGPSCEIRATYPPHYNNFRNCILWYGDINVTNNYEGQPNWTIYPPESGMNGMGVRKVVVTISYPNDNNLSEWSAADCGPGGAEGQPTFGVLAYGHFRFIGTDKESQWKNQNYYERLSEVWWGNYTSGPVDLFLRSCAYGDRWY